MDRELVLLEEARAEALRGILHYLEQAADLEVAVRFEAAMDRAFDAIRVAPERWPLVDRLSDERRYFFDRPFHEWMLIYYTDGDVVRVTAVAHGRRKPAYWRGRR